MTNELGKIIADLRKAKSLSQETLAKKVGRTKQWLGSIEVGRECPTLEHLLNLYKELVGKGSNATESDLKYWLLKWLEARVDKDVKQDKENVLAAISQLYGQSTAPSRIRPTSAVSTLADFPRGFENLLVVCGDRRESPPQRKGDFFADSFSSADLASLKQLFDKTGPLEIKSDKIFVSGNPGSMEYLKEVYGKRNLIVIGSPAVNLMARNINQFCVFRFVTSQIVRKFIDYWDKEIPEINDRKLREVFWDIASRWNEKGTGVEIDPNVYCEEYNRKADSELQKDQVLDLIRKARELLTVNRMNDLKNFFHRNGFRDPVANKEQGFFCRDDNDFGVISLCPNPYSDDGNYFCILAAGIHGPGTYMAVRALAKDTFVTHPLGGVFEVKLDPEAKWTEKFSSAVFEWQTDDYTIDHLLVRLRTPTSQSMLGRYEPEDLNKLRDFVERFASNTN